MTPERGFFYIPRTDSTMNRAREMAREGAPGGTAVRTGYQEAGRGRGEGRRWVSPPEESLLTTFILRDLPASVLPETLPLRVGLAALLAVEVLLGEVLTDGDLQIKWPNDLILKGGKAGGVLCEMDSGFFLAGIGINVLQTDFQKDLRVSLGERVSFRYPPTSLRMVFPGILPPNPSPVEALWHALADNLKLTTDGRGPYPWREKLDSRLLHRGETVRFRPGQGRDGGPFLEGRLEGVSPRGGIIIHAEGAREAETHWAGEFLP